MTTSIKALRVSERLCDKLSRVWPSAYASRNQEDVRKATVSGYTTQTPNLALARTAVVLPQCGQRKTEQEWEKCLIGTRDRHYPAHLGMSKLSWSRHCQDLQYHPYKVVRRQELQPQVDRLEFYKWLVTLTDEQLTKVLMSDEANFQLFGHVNSHWGAGNGPQGHRTSTPATSSSGAVWRPKCTVQS